MNVRRPLESTSALRVLTGYLVFALALSIWSIVGGRSGWIAMMAYAVLLAIVALVPRLDGVFPRVLLDWLPLLALPILYGAIPGTAVAVGPFDTIIQEWDRAIFRTDPARTLASTAPWRPLSELLHAAYLSYYAIIYLPPLLMYVQRDTAAFRRTVEAFTLAMVVCLVA